MTTPTTLEDIARQAIDGDREALEGLVRAPQGDVYGLALRTLWNREDAEDATQEILTRIVTLERDQTMRSYLHPVAGSEAAKIGAGLFTKALA